MVNKDPYEAIIEHFQSADSQLLAEAAGSSGLRHPTDTGTERERSLKRVLERFLPASCQVSRGGFLFNIRGESSRQIDIIVTAGMAPRLESHSRDIVVAPLEDTIGVAEVKSNLDKAKLYEALDNMAALPRLEEPQSRLPPFLKEQSPHFWWNWPLKVIFGFDAVSKETLYGHLKRYYQENPDIPPANRPSLIYVIGQYTIHRMTPGAQVLNADGSKAENQPTPGEYLWFANLGNVSAMAGIVTDLQERAFVARFMIWPYRQWVTNVVERAIRQDR